MIISRQDLQQLLHDQRGQSLVEVAVAALGLIVVLVAVVSGIMLSVRSSTFSNEQALATKYAQEGIELFRRYHGELGWQTFYSTISSDGNPVTYCLPSVSAIDQISDFRNLSNNSCSSSQVIDGTAFTREVTAQLNTPEPESITLTVRVTWPETESNPEATIVHVFRRRQ